MKKILLLSASLSLLCAAAACRKEAPAPVGQLEASPKTVSLGQGEIKYLQLKWTPTAPLAGITGAPTVFVHLLDDAGEVVRTFDHPLPQPWTVGTPISYTLPLYQSGIAQPLPPGDYRLSVGLFDQANKRWDLAGLGEPIAKREYVAATLTATRDTSSPQLDFPQMWMPAEDAGDKQVVSRRWLTTQGAVRLMGVQKPGKVWLKLRIPAGDGQGERLVVGDSSNVPSVIVRSSCGESTTSISGPGFHELEVDVNGPPQGGAQACRVILAPNYYLETANSPVHRSVSLENIAWIPAA